MLLPAGVPMDRQKAVYRVMVYKGEDPPRADVGIFATVVNSIVYNKVDFIDATVQVSFVGHMVRQTGHCNTTHSSKGQQLWLLANLVWGQI